MRILGLIGRVILGMAGVGLAVATVLALWPINATVPVIEARDSTQYWQMAGGYRIAYTHLRTATATRPPIVYLHGGPGGYIHSARGHGEYERAGPRVARSV